MVALGVVFTALVLFAHTLTVSLSDIGLARQRQTANALASGTVELARALPQDTLRRGLRTSDLAGDPNVTWCSGTYRFRACSGEPVVHTAGLITTAPLVPNRTTQTVPQSSKRYDVAAYVTSVSGDPATGPMRLVVTVSWDQKFRRGVAANVEVETILYSPKGCVNSSTHPIAAPCRSFYAGTASAANGGVRVKGTINGTPVTADFETVSARADAQLEQVQHIQGASRATRLGLTSLTTQSAGAESAASSADDDPGTTAVSTYDSNLFPAGPSSMLQEDISNGVSVQVSRTSGSSGSSTSASAAGLAAPGGGTQTCPTTTPPGPDNDGAACGHNWARQDGTSSTELALGALGPLGAANLASLGAAPEATDVQVDREPSSPDGALAITGTRSFGELRLAGLPSGVDAPEGWLGHWIRVNPFRDTVSAFIGDATAPPTASVTAGTVEVWNGLGYSSASLIGATPTELSIAPIGLTDVPAGDTLVDISISGSVRTGGASTQDPGGPGSGIARTEASATSTSPVVADVTYTLVVTDGGGTPLLDASLTISVDLGVLSAQADYREADVG